MATRLLRKVQLNEPSERNLFWTKLNKEVIKLEEWFKKMTSSLSEEKVDIFCYN